MPARTRVSSFLQSASNHKAELFMSTINAGEVFYSLAKRRGAAEAEEFLGDLPTMPIAMITPSRKQVFDAARLKARFPLSYADAFAVQTALECGASLVTGDEEIRAIADKIKLRLDWVAPK
jgi:predicted nucleic acid-binding protein